MQVIFFMKQISSNKDEKVNKMKINRINKNKL